MPDDLGKISFFQSAKIKCPVCSTKFQKEELFTGGGRLNAARLTDELHRLYHPSERYGNIFPAMYSVITCPECYYSTLKEDFDKVKKQSITVLATQAQINNRREAMYSAASELNFRSNRRLQEGIAAYIAGVYTYECFTSDAAPTLKQGICAIRAAWLAVHLAQDEPDENYEYLARILYRKAAYFYTQSVLLNDKGQEPLNTNAIIHYGPDIDHNFGLDGVIYLSALMQYKYGQRNDLELRCKRLEEAKIMIARLVGGGQVSRNKPSAILNPSRDLFEAIRDELKEHGYA